MRQALVLHKATFAKSVAIFHGIPKIVSLDTALSHES